MTDPKTTGLIHHAYLPPAGFGAVQPGVHKASTVIFPNTAALHARNWKEKTGYTYGLHGTPTSFTLEERIATLEGGKHTMLVSSGLAAVTMVDMALLKSGDQVLLPSATRCTTRWMPLLCRRPSRQLPNSSGSKRRVR